MGAPEAGGAPGIEIDILTLHPEMVRAPLEHSILGRARRAGRVRVDVHDIRVHATDRHRTVDDTPYGGGAGMVMKIDVVDRAIEAARRPESQVLLMSPAGERFDQRRAEAMAAAGGHVVLLCGHYEGVDGRVEHLIDGELSVGDFVLTGGELAALVVVDAVARLVPGVLGNAASAIEESFSAGRGGLEHPQYTRPRSYRGWEVPEVLLSGNHGAIEAWRREQGLARTRARRPDLLEPADD